jgi:hypothetical protein
MRRGMPVLDVNIHPEQRAVHPSAEHGDDEHSAGRQSPTIRWQPVAGQTTVAVEVIVMFFIVQTQPSHPAPAANRRYRPKHRPPAADVDDNFIST